MSVITEETKRVKARMIIQKVSEHFRISIDAMRAKNRKREVLIPRQVAIYLIRKHTDLSLNHTGSLFYNEHKPTGLDHTTVIHTVKEMDKLIDSGWKFSGMKLSDHIGMIEMDMEVKAIPTLIRVDRIGYVYDLKK